MTAYAAAGERGGRRAREGANRFNSSASSQFIAPDTGLRKRESQGKPEPTCRQSGNDAPHTTLPIPRSSTTINFLPFKHNINSLPCCEAWTRAGQPTGLRRAAEDAQARATGEAPTARGTALLRYRFPDGSDRQG